MTNNETPYLDVRLVDLAHNPPTHEELHKLKEALLVPHQKSQRIKKVIYGAVALTTLAFLISLSPSVRAGMAFIDYMLVGVIAWSIGFLIWGWIDDCIFERHQVDLKVDGAQFQRRAYESLRESKSFWDSDSIEDLSISNKAEEAKLYVDNVLHSIGRGFVRFDRELICYTLTK